MLQQVALSENLKGYKKLRFKYSYGSVRGEGVWVGSNVERERIIVELNTGEGFHGRKAHQNEWASSTKHDDETLKPRQVPTVVPRSQHFQ